MLYWLMNRQIARLYVLRLRAKKAIAKTLHASNFACGVNIGIKFRSDFLSESRDDRGQGGETQDESQNIFLKCIAPHSVASLSVEVFYGSLARHYEGVKRAKLRRSYAGFFDLTIRPCQNEGNPTQCDKPA